MKNSNLSNLNISDDIRKEFTVDRNGKGKTTQSGAARLLGISQQATSKLPVTLLQDIETYGVEGDNLENGVTDVVFGLIANYYAYESKASNPQAKAVAKTLAAIGSRTLFQSIAGWEAPSTVTNTLPPVSDTERVDNMATAVCKRYHGSDIPQDKVNLPDWLTVTEMLINLGEDADKDSGSLVHDHQFRFWINRQMSDVYRAQMGEEAPTVQRQKGSGYCYPASFFGLVKLYRSNWLLTQI